jgi:hypothetical protein
MRIGGIATLARDMQTPYACLSRYGQQEGKYVPTLFSASSMEYVCAYVVSHHPSCTQNPDQKYDGPDEGLLLGRPRVRTLSSLDLIRNL